MLLFNTIVKSSLIPLASGESIIKLVVVYQILWFRKENNTIYKISLKTLIGCEGGIIIIPLNFLSDERTKLRSEFLSKYEIKKINIFEESVFADTTYTVCSFFFKKKINVEQNVDVIFHPSKIEKKFKISKEYDYKIGGSFLNKITKYNLKIKRLVKNSKLILKLCV